MFAPTYEQQPDNTPTVVPTPNKGSKNMSRWKKNKDEIPQFNLIVDIRGEAKVGKTHLMMSAVELKEVMFMFYKFTGGTLYYIDLENAASLELAHNFKKYSDNIIIKNPLVFDDNNRIDYTKSYKEFKALIDELFVLKPTEGILCIDGAGFIGDATWFILIQEILKYSFDDFGNPNKKPQPHEFTWRKKEMKELMTKFRSMSIPIFMTNKVKKETENTEKFFKFTGNMVEDSIDGIDYHYDVEIVVEKMIKDSDIIRTAKIYDSRFEDEKVPILRYSIENPSMIKIFEKLTNTINRT